VGRQTILSLFEEQANTRPDAVAAVCETEGVTFACLNDAANRLARLLVSKGVRRESVVGVLLPRSIDTIVTMYAIFKSGGTYLPLDTRLPRARVDYMLSVSNASHVITVEDLAFDTSSPVLLLNTRETSDQLHVQVGRNLETSGDNALARHSAYVLFTSGSTGRPKGVVVDHVALLNFTNAVTEVLQLVETDIVLAATPVGFDISLFELAVSVALGARVAVLTDRDLEEWQWASKLFEKHKPTVIQTTPSRLAPLLNQHTVQQSGAVVISAGEVLSKGLAEKFLARGVRMINAYGPTECTIWTTCGTVKNEGTDAWRDPQIGTALPGCQVYVLNRWLQTAPAGVPGELYVAGEVLARGYCSMPGFTAERFVANPFDQQRPGSRMYRTGDRVVADATGALHFLGRNDSQVKVRGVRIELGEIETLLESRREIQRAVALITGKHQQLCALIQPIAGAVVDVEDVRRCLAEVLPPQAVPTLIRQVEGFKLTTSGKIDRTALPSIIDSPSPKAMPATPLEELLCRLTAEILGHDEVDVESNFFDIGGHSMLAVKLVSVIGEVLGKRISVKTVFQWPVVRDLARHLGEDAGDSAFAPALMLRSPATKPALFCLPPASGIGWCYSALLGSIESERGIVCLQDEYIQTGGQLVSSISIAAANYLRRIRELQVNGPYHLLGWSFGGLLAHAVACQLQEASQTVGLLSILDTFPGKQRTAAEDDLFDEAWGTALTTALSGGGGASKAVERTVMFARHARDLAYSYKPARFHGDALLFMTADLQHSVTSWFPWIEGSVEVAVVNCGHADLVSRPHLVEIGRRVEAEMLKIELM